MAAQRMSVPPAITTSMRIQQALRLARQTALRSEAYMHAYRKRYPVVIPDAQGRITRQYPDGREEILHPAPGHASGPMQR